MENMMSKLDVDRDGEVTMDEWMAAMPSDFKAGLRALGPSFLEVRCIRAAAVAPSALHPPPPPPPQVSARCNDTPPRRCVSLRRLRVFTRRSS
jgi:hypothetical protein